MASMRRLSVLLLCLALLAPAPSLADAGVSVTVNRQAVPMDVPPQIAQGRVLVPARPLLASLGATVAWDARTRTITALDVGGTQLEMRIGAKIAWVNGRPVELAVAPQIVAGRTLVPVRFVAEALGARVAWDPQTRAVTVLSAPPTDRSPPAEGAPSPGGGGANPGGAGGSNTPAAVGPVDLVPRILPATVHIKIKLAEGTALGSGFFLGSQGLVVTNHHVIANAQALEVVTHDRKVHRVVSVLADNPGLDVALLQTDATGYPALELATDAAPPPGARVIAVGSPMGLTWTVSEGIISGPLRLIDAREWVQHTAPVSPGSSGGPLVLEATGQVVAMNTWAVGDEHAQNLNFAVPAATIRTVWQAAPAEAAQPPEAAQAPETAQPPKADQQVEAEALR
jgi:S1-C subfamily serine protease